LFIGKGSIPAIDRHEIIQAPGAQNSLLEFRNSPDGGAWNINLSTVASLQFT
jgi:hypothetical protein